MTGWKDMNLGDLAIFKNGKARPKSSGSYPVYGGNGILDFAGEYNCTGEVVVVGRVGAYCGSVYYEDKEIWISDNAMFATPKQKFDTKFLFYFLKNLDLNSFAEGSSHPLLTQNLLNSIEIYATDDPNSQKAIAEVLSSLDDKIDLLHRQNKTLESLAQTLFRQWFIEEADDSWKTRTIVEFAPVITGKKDANYGSEDGIYPFFTCSQKALKCDYFSYDGHAILLAGNGDFNLKRYKGKFEAYQRTYILIPHDEKYVGFLFYLMKHFLDEMTSSAQGSVISFLTKGMITDFEFLFPEVSPDTRLLELNSIDERIDANLRQIQTLSKLRDALLPKLMSGEVSVNAL
jgi:type I restriction enzyme S subunit